MSLATEISSNIGAPSSVRIGTVTGDNPLTVDMGGTPLVADGTEQSPLGLLCSYMPKVGDVVALLGQSSTISSDPGTWMVLGCIARSTGATMAAQTGEEVLSFGPATSFVLNVVFPVPFTARPTVTVNIAQSPAATAGWNARAINITAVDFDIHVFGTSNTWSNVPVQWQAIPFTG